MGKVTWSGTIPVSQFKLWYWDARPDFMPESNDYNGIGFWGPNGLGGLSVWLRWRQQQQTIVRKSFECIGHADRKRPFFSKSSKSTTKPGTKMLKTPSLYTLIRSFKSILGVGSWQKGSLAHIVRDAIRTYPSKKFQSIFRLFWAAFRPFLGEP